MLKDGRLTDGGSTFERGENEAREEKTRFGLVKI
jgi:hypothetical protein